MTLSQTFTKHVDSAGSLAVNLDNLCSKSTRLTRKCRKIETINGGFYVFADGSSVRMSRAVDYYEVLDIDWTDYYLLPAHNFK